MVEFDAQGRFSIPQSLRKYAGLASQVMLVGLGDKFEIWAQSEWDLIFADLTQTFEDTLNSVAEAADLLPSEDSSARPADSEVASSSRTKAQSKKKTGAR